MKAIAERIRIVTVSAKIYMPTAFGSIFDVMGEWDLFGGPNSRPDIKTDFIVPRAWRSTNPDFLMGMGVEVTATLKTVMPMTPPPSFRASRSRPADLFNLPQRLTAVRYAQAARPFAPMAPMKLLAG